VNSRRGVNPPHDPTEEPARAVSDPRRELPSVDRLASSIARSDSSIPGWAATAAARTVIARGRQRLEEGGEASLVAGELDDLGLAEARRLTAKRPERVINATGVVLHTNLGRAPLGPGAAAALAEAAIGYSDLELDLATGRRGSRLGSLGEKLALLAGAEAATACNNNAAALVLALDALARGREVVVSRGELVEIGGSFRIPEIAAKAGVELVEVGSTNRTHLRDYERAIGPRTALLLKVHRSNFEQRGFVSEVELERLVALGRERSVAVVEDLGSGSFVDLRARGLGDIPAESFVAARVATGADVVCFSGDKLLGGPQAGIAVGRASAIEAMRASPLARALRLDKLAITALDWLARALLDERLDEIPVLARLLEPASAVEARAGRLLAALEQGGLPAGASARVVADRAPVGGGSVPGFELDTFGVELAPGGALPASASALARALRGARPPVLARIREERVFLDMRSVDDLELPLVAAAVALLASGGEAAHMGRLR